MDILTSSLLHSFLRDSCPNFNPTNHNNILPRKQSVQMASVTMAAASFLATSVSVVKQPARSALVVNAKASSVLLSQPQKASVQLKTREEERSSRRDLVLAATAAAACLVAKVAMADDEPKPGTPEAKKKYAPVCVSMPTARICHK